MNKTSTVVRANTTERTLLGVLVFVAFVTSFLPESQGAVAVLGITTAIVFWLNFTRIIFRREVMILGALGLFVGSMMVLASRAWVNGFSLDRCLAILGYLFFLPAVWAGIAREGKEYDSILIGVHIFVLSASVAIVAEGLRPELTFTRILNANIHKNTIGLTLTPLLLVWIFSFNKLAYRILAAALALIVLTVLLSKASILVVLIMMFSEMLTPVVCMIVCWAVFIVGYMARDSLYYVNFFDTIFQRSLLMEEAWAELVVSDQTFMMGIGPGMFRSKLLVFGLEENTSSHNAILDIWCGFGFIVTAIIVVYLVVFFYKLRACRGPFLIGFCGFFAHSMFDVGWVRGPGFIAAIVMGAALAEFARVRASRNPQRERLNRHP